MPTIGIDAIAIAVPEGYVDLADLATARGVPPSKYVEGLVRTDYSQVFVSRGLGTVGLPLRFNCRPEIVLLTLT